MACGNVFFYYYYNVYSPFRGHSTVIVHLEGLKGNREVNEVTQLRGLTGGYFDFYALSLEIKVYEHLVLIYIGYSFYVKV